MSANKTNDDVIVNSNADSSSLYWSLTYAAYLLAQAILNFIGAYVMIVGFVLSASKNLHNFFMKKISSAVTAFFDATPVGRILTRYASVE